jgi:hypothetical protein
MLKNLTLDWISIVDGLLTGASRQVPKMKNAMNKLEILGHGF